MDENARVVDELVDAWRRRTVGILRPLNHRCTAACSMLKLTGYACSTCGGASSTRCCQDAQEVHHAYVCENTGYGHACGPHCAYRSTHNVCPVTGMVHGTNTVPMSAGHYATAPAESRNRLYSSDAIIHESCVGITYALLFSTERVRFEEHRRKMLRVSAERAVHRYRRQQANRGHICTYMDMVLIYVHKYYRCKPVTHLRMTYVDKKKVCHAYANAVQIIMNDLQIMKQCANIRLDAVIVVLLYMMRSGCIINQTIFLEIDQFLRLYLPDAHAICSLLLTPINFTATKQAISHLLLQKKNNSAWTDGQKATMEAAAMAKQIMTTCLPGGSKRLFRNDLFTNTATPRLHFAPTSTCS